MNARGERILYVGGFELPDKNAAAHRVVGNAKIFRDLGYQVEFLGVSKILNKNTDSLIEEDYYEGFRYWLIPYPKSLPSWVRYESSIKNIISIIEKDKKAYDVIIAYNFPAVALYKLLKYCKKNNIKLVSDCTEWYNYQRNSILGIIKCLDSELRMRFLNKKVDGVICISEYLYNYYENVKNKIILTPLVDLEDKKWIIDRSAQNSKIKLTYAGSPGSSKDKINLVIDSLMKINYFNRNVSLNIVGMTRDGYFKIYPDHKPQETFIDEFTIFYGRIPHVCTLELIKQSDFTIFLRERTRSNMAGFPTKFVESISCGTPVITNKTSDLEKYLVDGENGFWIDINDEKARLNKLSEIFSMPRTKIEIMKEKVTGSKMFDYRKMTDKVDIFIKNIMQL